LRISPPTEQRQAAITSAEVDNSLVIVINVVGWRLTTFMTRGAS